MSELDVRVDRLLRAYPHWVRVTRGPEIAGTIMDLLPEDATRIPLAMALDVLLGGLRSRWHDPPLRVRLALLAESKAPLDPRWHGWLLDDVFRPRYWCREAVRRGLMYLPIWTLLEWLLSTAGESPAGWWWRSLIRSGTWGLVQSMFSARHRQRALERNGYRGDGVPDGNLQLVWERFAPVPNLRLAPMLLTAGLSLLVAGPASVWAIHHRWVLVANPVPRRPGGVPGSITREFVGIAIVALVLVVIEARRILRLRTRPSASAPLSRPDWLPQLVVGTTAVMFSLWLVIGAAIGTVDEGPILFCLGLMPLAFAASVVGLALIWVERRRGQPVGWWDLNPRHEPRLRLVFQRIPPPPLAPAPPTFAPSPDQPPSFPLPPGVG